MTPDLDRILRAEADSWIHGDSDKLQRERIRHHRLVRDLLLDKLDTHGMNVLEVGGGPLPVSDLVSFRERIVVDPLAKAYRTIAPCHDHVAMSIEDLETEDWADLVIATNSLDHVKSPELACERIKQVARPGAYVAILCAENNALTHPHEAHEHNLTVDLIHRWFDRDYETVHELSYAVDGYRYGHVLYAGKRGQPAFAILLRRCSGYS